MYFSLKNQPRNSANTKRFAFFWLKNLSKAFVPVNLVFSFNMNTLNVSISTPNLEHTLDSFSLNSPFLIREMVFCTMLQQAFLVISLLASFFFFSTRFVLRILLTLLILLLSLVLVSSFLDSFLWDFSESLETKRINRFWSRQVN